MLEIYVAGVGLSAFGRRPESFLDLLLEARHAALSETGEVDAIILGAMAPGEYLHEGPKYACGEATISEEGSERIHAALPFASAFAGLLLLAELLKLSLPGYFALAVRA